MSDDIQWVQKNIAGHRSNSLQKLEINKYVTLQILESCINKYSFTQNQKTKLICKTIEDYQKMKQFDDMYLRDIIFKYVKAADNQGQMQILDQIMKN